MREGREAYEIDAYCRFVMLAELVVLGEGGRTAKRMRMADLPT